MRRPRATRLRAAHSDEPLVALLIDAAIAHTKADLQVVESASTRLAPIAQAAHPHTGAAIGEKEPPPVAGAS